VDQSNQAIFKDRIRRIERTRKKARVPLPSKGKPIHRPWRRLEAGLKLASLSALAVLGVKVAFLVTLGPEAYAHHRAVLEQGTSIERMGAALMAPDLVTGFVAQRLSGSGSQAAVADATAAAPAAADVPPKRAPVVIRGGARSSARFRAAPAPAAH
jgi:hypothetical protein